MSYGDLIRELHRRSGKQINEYADAVDISVTHMSHILNDRQPGTRKVLEACLYEAGLGLEDLQLPEKDPESQEERKAMRLFRSLSDKHRATALDLLASLSELQSLKLKGRQKRDQ